MPTYRFNVLCGFHTLFPVRFRSELEEPLVVQIHRTSDVFFPEVRFVEVNSHSIIAPRGFRRANVQASVARAERALACKPLFDAAAQPCSRSLAPSTSHSP